MLDRVALITGAGRGIGRAIALELARNGADVFLVARTEAQLLAVAEEVRALGRKAEIIVADVSHAEDVANAVDVAIKTYGHVDILVNNAGITRDTLLVRMKDDDWNMVIDTNLRSAFLFSRACAKSMMKRRFGRIINISSVVGLTGNAGQCNYAASKAGIIGLTKALARELASRGITANAVAPGFIATEMTENLAADSALMNKIPIGVPGTVQDVANAVRFLASDRSGYITGQVLNVDGGMAM
ncbi:3-oxoacyl-[bacterium]|nr:3-oxoacyl-[acyl-carrier-protein] reductase [bacterium]